MVGILSRKVFAEEVGNISLVVASPDRGEAISNTMREIASSGFRCYRTSTLAMTGSGF